MDFPCRSEFTRGWPVPFPFPAAQKRFTWLRGLPAQEAGSECQSAIQNGKTLLKQLIKMFGTLSRVNGISPMARTHETWQKLALWWTSHNNPTPTPSSMTTTTTNATTTQTERRREVLYAMHMNFKGIVSSRILMNHSTMTLARVSLHAFQHSCAVTAGPGSCRQWVTFSVIFTALFQPVDDSNCSSQKRTKAWRWKRPGISTYSNIAIRPLNVNRGLGISLSRKSGCDKVQSRVFHSIDGCQELVLQLTLEAGTDSFLWNPSNQIPPLWIPSLCGIKDIKVYQGISWHIKVCKSVEQGRLPIHKLTWCIMMHSQKVPHCCRCLRSSLLDCKLSTWARNRSFGEMARISNSIDFRFEAIRTIDFQDILHINTLTKRPIWRQPRSFLLQSSPANLGLTQCFYSIQCHIIPLHVRPLNSDTQKS